MIAIPSFPELHRDVTPMDGLMVRCRQLAANRTTCSRLHNALLAEALPPLETRELEEVG